MEREVGASCWPGAFLFLSDNNLNFKFKHFLYNCVWFLCIYMFVVVPALSGHAIKIPDVLVHVAINSNFKDNSYVESCFLCTVLCVAVRKSFNFDGGWKSQVLKILSPWWDLKTQRRHSQLYFSLICLQQTSDFQGVKQAGFVSFPKWKWNYIVLKSSISCQPCCTNYPGKLVRSPIHFLLSSQVKRRPCPVYWEKNTYLWPIHSKLAEFNLLFTVSILIA